MKNRRNYYRVLQVQPDAPQAVIKASYKALMRELKMHPDLGGDHWQASVINEAYETLKDATRRAAYDRQLFERYTKSPFDSNKRPLISYFCPFCKRPFARQANSHEACPACQSPLASNVHSPQPNRRAIERIRKSGHVQLLGDWSPNPIQGKVVDLSPNGMRFQCRAKLLTNMAIKIGNQYLQAVAVVRNTHKIIEHGETLYSVGVEFLSVQFKQSKGSFYTAST
jgi:curved DNA-binding protein CbpA